MKKKQFEKWQAMINKAGEAFQEASVKIQTLNESLKPFLDNKGKLIRK